MSALGQKQTLRYVPSMSALPPKADIETGTRALRSGQQQLRQLGDICRDLARLVSPVALVFAIAVA